MQHESIEDAFRAVIAACGGAKCVAAQMWADKPPDAAHRLLLACLNEDRPERLGPYHVMTLLRLGRQADAHDAMQFLADFAGYAIEPLDSRVDLADLRRQLVDAKQVVERLSAQIAQHGPQLVNRTCTASGGVPRRS